MNRKIFKAQRRSQGCNETQIDCDILVSTLDRKLFKPCCLLNHTFIAPTSNLSGLRPRLSAFTTSFAGVLE